MLELVQQKIGEKLVPKKYRPSYCVAELTRRLDFENKHTK